MCFWPSAATQIHENPFDPNMRLQCAKYPLKILKMEPLRLAKNAFPAYSYMK